MELDEETIWKHFRSMCQERRGWQSEFADANGFSRQFVNDVYHGRRGMTADVAKALGYEVKKVYRPLDQETATV